ncbi:MAG TPA: hypothetical protein VM658_11865 [bacterium]|nr:hypothetical protein [bacterium]
MSGEARQRDVLGLAAAASVVLLAVALASFRVFNYDLFWHLRTGQWIVDHLSVPRQDMFSFTREGMEWIDAQWLFQLVLYAFYSAFGGKGTTLLQALLTAGTLLFLLFSVPGKIPLAARSLLGFVFLLSFNPRINCRPENLSCLYMAGMFFALERARMGRSRWLLPVVILQLLFVNSEGLWPIGLAMAGAYAGDAAREMIKEKGLSRRRRELYAWFFALAAMAAFSAVQPYWLRGALFPFTLLEETALKGMLHKKIISDLQPIFVTAWPERVLVPYCALTVLCLAAVVLAGRRGRPLLVLLAIIISYLAFTARRNVSVGSVILMPSLLAHVAVLTEKRPGWLRAPVVIRWSGLLAIVGAAFIALLSLAIPARQWDRSGRRPGFGIETGKYPVETASYLKSIGYRGNIINSENIGGYLIWSLWPECKVFADPRMELGGEEAIIFYLETYNDQDKLARVADQFRAEAVATAYRKPYTEFFQRMAADRRWALVHLDWNAAVFLRRDERWGRVISRDEIKDPLNYVLTPPPS